MALITSQEIKSNTSMGGNVDPDKFMHLLTDVEVLILEPILGTALFDKIVTDFNADTLSGDYLEMFTGYIKPILWHSVYAQYLRDGIVLAQNTGIYENAPDNGLTANIDNVKYNVKGAQSKADAYINRLERYLCDKNIAEYVDSQPNDYDVHPQEVNTIGGWYLGRTMAERPYTIGKSENGLELE
jgi:hypothetical protein